MSKETVVRCDMCGAVVDDNSKGVVYRDVWGHIDATDLCGACVEKVRGFVKKTRNGKDSGND
nr:MAG TPA: hypothetical protein [Caudoviricetes sp.]